DFHVTGVQTCALPIFRQRVRIGTADQQIVDTVYGAMGRVQCTIVRMNPATWGTVLGSCPSTAAVGPNGPDRITYNHYDALGRVRSEERRVGEGWRGRG